MGRRRNDSKLPGALCECGCGKPVPAHRVAYHNDACKHRAAQRRYAATHPRSTARCTNRITLTDEQIEQRRQELLAGRGR